MCCITVLFYKLLQKCRRSPSQQSCGHKKKEEAALDKQHDLFTLEEHIDEKMIELINDMYKWRNSLRKFPIRKSKQL